MARILGVGVVTLLLLGCGQAANRSLIGTRASHPYAPQGGPAAGYALAATTPGVDRAWHRVPSHAVSENIWSALLSRAALTPALRTASESLLQSQLRKMDVLADNIANAETVGFKRTRVFIETRGTTAGGGSVQEGSEPGAPSEGAPIAGGRATVRTEILFDQGSALEARNLDVMIEGYGFFRVKLPDGRIGYTRAGHFVRTADGVIVPNVGQGLRLVDTLVIPEAMATDDVWIDSSGEVSGVDEDGEAQIIGQLRLARFPNPSGLRRYTANVFLPADAVGVPIVGVPGEDGLGMLIPGCLERSNADFVSELLELATTRQRFDATLVLLRLAAAAPAAGQSLTE